MNKLFVFIFLVVSLTLSTVVISATEANVNSGVVTDYAVVDEASDKALPVLEESPVEDEFLYEEGYVIEESPVQEPAPEEPPISEESPVEDDFSYEEDYIVEESPVYEPEPEAPPIWEESPETDDFLYEEDYIIEEWPIYEPVPEEPLVTDQYGHYIEVTFHPNGGNWDGDILPQTVTIPIDPETGALLGEQMPEAPEMPGYTFAGWNTQPDGEGEWVYISNERRDDLYETVY